LQPFFYDVASRRNSVSVDAIKKETLFVPMVVGRVVKSSSVAKPTVVANCIYGVAIFNSIAFAIL